MTNIYLQQAAPVSISDQAGEVLSALVLVLSGILALVALVTV